MSVLRQLLSGDERMLPPQESACRDAMGEACTDWIGGIAEKLAQAAISGPRLDGNYNKISWLGVGMDDASYTVS